MSDDKAQQLRLELCARIKEAAEAMRLEEVMQGALLPH